MSLEGGVSVLTALGAAGPGHFTPDGRALAFTRIGPSRGTADTGRPGERAVVVRFE